MTRSEYVSADLKPSKRKLWFDDVVNEGGKGEIHDITNWHFLSRDDAFPSRRCTECEAALRVLPLRCVGQGERQDARRSHSVGLFKVAALCSNYPDCEFPLFHIMYSQFWIRTAWYDDRKSKKKSGEEEKVLEEKVSGVVKEEKVLTKPASKKRKLMQDSREILTYEYLRSLSDDQ